ncbi:MAG: type I restriction enzyme HsdR N-terminal domain-containing protein [Bacteroidota bacterium]|nr:type I restriction enzyme HsdR N-terminal domain-containing protein [Bacteroidota bacterium]
MKTLTLPPARLQIRNENGKPRIWDDFRKKYVSLTPEEWVRQHFLHYLATEKKYPASLICVESGLTYNRRKKRSDILVYSSQGNPLMIIECKAPEVPVTEDVFQQAATYNMTLRVPYLVVTNGIDHYVCHIDHENHSFTFLREIPAFDEINLNK